MKQGEEKLYAVALLFKRGIGYKKAEQLLSSYGSLSDAVKEEGIELSQELKRAEEELKKAEEIDAKIITFIDEDYPKELLSLSQPPLALYVKGKIPQTKRIAIVGSRRCSDYGRRTAYKLSSMLSSSGVCVVSGLAVGIDSAAHRGALGGGGKTVAVLGSSLDRLYPASNKALAEKIVSDGGAIVSEFPFGTQAKRELFPRRNRIIAALSEAVLVVEAMEKSGAFITVDHALEIGKEVFAVPGNIDSPYSRGSNRLIAEGATPVWDAEEFVSSFAPKKVQREPEEFKEVYFALLDSPSTVDELSQRLGMDAPALSYALTILEMEGFVKREGIKWIAL